jgi:hypothetical protein
MAGIIKQPIRPPGNGREPIHGLLHDARGLVVKGIARFPGLEINVRVLRRAANAGPVGSQAVVAEGLDKSHARVHHGPQLFVRQGADFGHFVRGAKTVEEVKERHPRGEGRGMGHASQVLRLLHRAGGKHGKAGGAAGHHVGMIAKNGKRVRRQRPRRHVHAEREQFPGDLIHVWDHQQQPLRRGESRAEGTDLQHPVQRPGGAGFRLHFHHPRHRAE